MSSASIGRVHPSRGISFRHEKVACIATLSLVFLIGALTGAALMTTGGAYRRFHRSVPFWTEAGRQISHENWKTELNLSPSQTEEMAVILEDFAKYYRTVTGDAKTRILKILDEGQKKQFERLLGKARY
jgi:hypothetical protein